MGVAELVRVDVAGVALEQVLDLGAVEQQETREGGRGDEFKYWRIRSAVPDRSKGRVAPSLLFVMTPSLHILTVTFLAIPGHQVHLSTHVSSSDAHNPVDAVSHHDHYAATLCHDHTITML